MKRTVNWVNPISNINESGVPQEPSIMMNENFNAPVINWNHNLQNQYNNLMLNLPQPQYPIWYYKYPYMSESGIVPLQNIPVVQRYGIDIDPIVDDDIPEAPQCPCFGFGFGGGES